MKYWMRKWRISILSCLILIAACGTGLIALNKDKETATQPVINQIRLQVNEIMLLLSQSHERIADTEIQAMLRKMADKQQLSILYAGLDGQVLFSSNITQSTQKLNLDTDIHYDLYYAKANDNTYRIAFPVVDEDELLQVGNAVFTVPSNAVFAEKGNRRAEALLAAMILIVCITILLAIWMERKVKRDIIAPIHQLKNYSEGILKGDYSQLVLSSDIEEISDVNAMFDQMRLEIMTHSQQRDEQEQAQKELVTSISHEIKTPLATVKAYIEAIQEGVCEDMSSVMDYLEVMHTNTEKMARLTEDLLLHAMKELGQISVTLTEQYSRDVLEPIMKQMAHYVRASGVQFEGPKDIPNVLLGLDAQRLEQVISNLISNALKHTEPGDRIKVQVGLVEGHLEITIADTGRGIHPADMPFIFDRYFRGNLNSAPKRQGSGLGLSICKHIIEAHRGSISFQSAQDRGTVFYCRIPL